jgi:outer membrane lipoprotein
VLLLAVAVLGGCAAAPPFESAGANSALTASQAAAEIDRWQGSRVVWGGVIVASRNLARSTEIEVLAYPLDSAQRPKTRSEAQGRFVVVVPGYLETVDYGAGRTLTVSGIISGLQQRRLGEVMYAHAVVDAEQVQLWPQAPRQEWAPQFHIGIGIGL